MVQYPWLENSMDTAQQATVQGGRKKSEMTERLDTYTHTHTHTHTHTSSNIMVLAQFKYRRYVFCICHCLTWQENRG